MPPPGPFSAAVASSACEPLRHANVLSLVASAALGETVLFLVSNTTVGLTGRRVALVRELTRIEVRRVFGLHEGCRVPQRLLAREPLSVLGELQHAVKHGTQSVMLRYRTAEHALGVRVPAA